MPDHCVQCHQADPEVDVNLLRVQHELSFRGSKTPSWTIVRQQYCQTCYRQAEQAQHQRELAKLQMALLPLMWFLVSGALLYGGLYPNPSTAPIEVHVFFLGTTLAAFYIIPTTIYQRFKRLKRLKPQPRAMQQHGS